jgi:predicted amidohydrolase YtcJ
MHIQFLAFLLLGAMLAGASGVAVGKPRIKPANLAYRNGSIHTVDAADGVHAALAVRAGRIVYLGDDAGLAAYLGPRTQVIDLHGRMLMPGLIDGHMHPVEGGADLLKCSLGYGQLDVPAMQHRIQACLDQSRDQEPDRWLEVVNWFQEGMTPAGTVTSHATLDALHTKRPIFVMSSFGHTALVNARGLELTGLTAASKDPQGGRIARDAAGNPTGILEDAAHEAVIRLLPKPSAADEVASAKAALAAMRRQGITTFLDASTLEPDLAAFATLQRAGLLTARAHFAVLITPPEGAQPDQAVRNVIALAGRYDQGPIVAAPRLTVRNVKLFLDGVITAPAMTGAMLAPYFVPASRPELPWVPGTTRGPDVYFPAPVLEALLAKLAAAGFEPHMHADGDRAVHEALDGIASMRRKYPTRDIRAAIAHDEIVDPADFGRYRALDAVPVLSFQWGKPAPDTVDGARDYLGPARYKFMEPSGFLAAAGARLAYGSDWPVDPLDEWFALKVGVTRTNAPTADAKYRGRLSEDPGLARTAVLRAITAGAAYELHQERETGSLEVGKLADLIVLDQDFFAIPAEQIATIKVLQTVVGGRIVYQADGF